MAQKPVPTTPQALIVSADNPIAAFLESLAARGRSAATARGYISQLRSFESWLKTNYSDGLLDATAHDVQRYKAQLASQRAPNSVNAALAALRQFYGWAFTTGVIQANPTKDLENVKRVELSPQGFSPTERRRLEREAEKLGPMADAIVTTLLNTGLRISEMTGLSWERIAIGERSGWARINGKGGKFREIPLNLPVRKALVAIRPDPAIGPVYRSRRGPYSPRGVRDLLTELGRRANVQSVHPHRFRHEAARQMIRNGVDLPTVAKILGHKRLETLMIYTQPGPDDLEKAVAALEKV